MDTRRETAPDQRMGEERSTSLQPSHAILLALVRLLGRQAAREYIAQQDEERRP